MARRPAEGNLDGVLVFRPALGRRPGSPDTNATVIGSTGWAHHRITDQHWSLSSSCSASELQLVRLRPGSDIKACKRERPCT